MFSVKTTSNWPGFLPAASRGCRPTQTQRYLRIIFGSLFTTFLHSREESTLALSTLITFFLRFMAMSNASNSYSPDLILVICKGVYGGHDAVHFLRTALSEIQAAGQFSHNNHVETVTDNLLL